MQPAAPKTGSTGTSSLRFGRRESLSMGREGSPNAVMAPSVPTLPKNVTENRGTASFRFSRSRSRDLSVGPSVSVENNDDDDFTAPPPVTGVMSPLKKTSQKEQQHREEAKQEDEVELSPYPGGRGGTGNDYGQPLRRDTNTIPVSPSPQTLSSGCTRRVVASSGVVKCLLGTVFAEATAVCEFCLQVVSETAFPVHLVNCSRRPPALESADTQRPPVIVASTTTNTPMKKPRPQSHRSKRPIIKACGVEQELFRDEAASADQPLLTPPAAGGAGASRSNQSQLVSQPRAEQDASRILLACAVCQQMAPILSTVGRGALQTKLCDTEHRRIHFISSCDHPVCTLCLYSHLETVVGEETRSTMLHLHKNSLSNSSCTSSGIRGMSEGLIESKTTDCSVAASLHPSAKSGRTSGLRLDFDETIGGDVLTPSNESKGDTTGTGMRDLTAVGNGAVPPTSLMHTPCPVGDCGATLEQQDLRQLLPLAVVEEYLNRHFLKYITEQLAHSGRSGYLKCPNCSTVVQRQVEFEKEVEGTTMGGQGGRGFDLQGNHRRHHQIAGGSPAGKKESNGPLMIEGSVVNLATKQHYDEYRLRCTHCMATFCHGCHEAPYHTGASCDQHKARSNALKCRFCGETAAPPPPPGFFGNLFRKNRAADVCSAAECVQMAEKVCHKTLSCGHPCRGVSDEEQCPPCLEEGCVENTTNQCGGDFCTICHVDELGVGGCIELGCGHVFHLDCIKQKLERKWPSPRITFTFLNCPTCSVPIRHPLLTLQLKELYKFKELVKSKVILRMEHEGLSNADVVNNPESEYYQDPVRYGEDMLAYYPCFKCNKPYFGGFKRCEAVADDDQFNPSELICSGCVPNKDMRQCRIHGTDFIEYKCRFCCSIAQWYCWGTTHFCTSCHRRQELGDYLTKKKKEDLPKCDGPRSCPLGVDHPPSGTEHAMGCAMCRKNKASINF